MHNYRTVKCDLLIIGSGAAGLRSAIEAHDGGVKDLIVIGKCKKGDAHTVLATGGINAALGTMDPKDSWLIHAADTLREGGHIADYREVETLCKNAPDAVEELVRWGARFHTEKDGRLTQRFFGAHTYRRTCFYGDQTGKEIMRVLIKQVERRRIRFLGDIFIFSLLKDAGTISGAIGIDFQKGEMVVFNAKSVILAAGGYSKLYSRSSSRSYENHGDGAALAFEAGVDLVGMEMVQFHPTGMVYPKSAQGTLVTEAVRGEGGILLNAKGERFMRKYDPGHMELGPRDLVARSIYLEIMKGNGTKHGGVWLDITGIPKAKILDRLPKMYAQFKELVGLDISKEKMEVAPTAHYTMGGVDVSLKGATKIKGLFAVGETVGQIHGANRLGGNSLLETVVFGKIVGEEAARFAKGCKMQAISPDYIGKKMMQVVGYFGRDQVDIEKLRSRLQASIWKHAGIARDAKSLKAGLSDLKSIRAEFDRVRVRGEFKGNLHLKMALEMGKMLDLCEVLLQSALARKESRCAHYRTDYPKRDDRRWKVNIIASKLNGGIVLKKRKVPAVKGKLNDALKAVEKTEHKLLE
ncbi:MAG: FAD-binding protein [Candidatus Micrarchaeota archaeon]|nr:FAD-binding protein [Candidatus Micrarchaeota archaeon]